MALWASGETTSAVPSVRVYFFMLSHQLRDRNRPKRNALDGTRMVRYTRAMPNFLRPLRRSAFQVVINDFLAAVLNVTADAVEIYVDRAEIVLLATVTGTTDAGAVAARIAAGEFDNDFRFEIRENPEPSSNADLYFMTQYATPSQQLIDSFTSEDPGRTVESAREAQEFTLEERFDMYAERGW